MGNPANIAGYPIGITSQDRYGGACQNQLKASLPTLFLDARPIGVSLCTSIITSREPESPQPHLPQFLEPPAGLIDPVHPNRPLVWFQSQIPRHHPNILPVFLNRYPTPPCVEVLGAFLSPLGILSSSRGTRINKTRGIEGDCVQTRRG